ncbi:MAG: type IX secretion system membrane protein PorP/SprF [Cytophagales bacterium]|nr:MAG: type IX secretion system membrane protein PorP/SprF [Cytophagales bacterium]
MHTSFKKIINYSFILMFFYQISKAQDFNFSQFYNTPIILNPANSGRMDKDVRIGLIHRSAFSTYTNSALMADMNIYNTPLKTDMMGVGLFVFNDQQGNGQISNNGFMLSGAAHYSLDEAKKHRLSIGIQIGMSFATLNLAEAKFASDFDQTTNQFSTSSSNNGSYNNPGLKSNGGLIYQLVLNRNLDFTAGVTAYNLIPSKQNFVVKTQSNTPIRFGFQLGMNYMIKNKFQISPAVNFMNQSSTKDLIMGSNFSYYFINDVKTNKKAAFTVGVWHRLQDAMIVYVGGKYNNFQLGFSYDLTVSSLAKATGKAPEFGRNTGNGAWEISLFYSGFLNRAIPDKTTVPCRTF